MIPDCSLPPIDHASNVRSTNQKNNSKIDIADRKIGEISKSDIHKTNLSSSSELRPNTKISPEIELSTNNKTLSKVKTIKGNFFKSKLKTIQTQTRSKLANIKTIFKPKILQKDLGKILNQLEVALEQKDDKTFLFLLTKLKTMGFNKQISYLVEKLLQKQYTLVANGQRDDYEFILKNLIILYPNINTYFTNLSPSFLGLGEVSLTSNSIDIVLKYLKNKNSFDDMDCVVCPNLENFNTQLSQYIRKIAKLDPDVSQRICFITSNASEFQPRANHFTPVYLERTSNNEFRIFITDSLGGSEPHVNMLMNKIKTVCSQEFPDQKINFYVYNGPARQKDNENCSIFSIRDAVQFGKHSEAIFDWADQQTSLSLSHISLKSLPPMMMKTTQTLATIDTYDQKNPETPVQLNPRHRVMDAERNKLVNFKIANHYLKYELLVWTTIISQGIKHS